MLSLVLPCVGLEPVSHSDFEVMHHCVFTHYGLGQCYPNFKPIAINTKTVVFNFTFIIVQSYLFIHLLLTGSSLSHFSSVVLTKCAFLGRAGCHFIWTQVCFSSAMFFFWLFSLMPLRKLYWLPECLRCSTHILISLAWTFPLTCLFRTMPGLASICRGCQLLWNLEVFFVNRPLLPSHPHYHLSQKFTYV